MFVFDLIAEQKIAEAIARGEFADLPGEGRPLDLEDDALIPEDLRMAYRVLKNSGYLPPEVETLRNIAQLEQSIDALPEGGARTAAYRKLQFLRMRLESSGVVRAGIGLGGRYSAQILDRLAGVSHDP